MKAVLRGKFIAHKENEERSLDKRLSKLIKRQRYNIQINTIRNEKGYMTTDTKEIQGMLRSYYKNL